MVQKVSSGQKSQPVPNKESTRKRSWSEDEDQLLGKPKKLCFNYVMK